MDANQYQMYIYTVEVTQNIWEWTNRPRPKHTVAREMALIAQAREFADVNPDLGYLIH